MNIPRVVLMKYIPTYTTKKLSIMPKTSLSFSYKIPHIGKYVSIDFGVQYSPYLSTHHDFLSSSFHFLFLIAGVIVLCKHLRLVHLRIFDSASSGSNGILSEGLMGNILKPSPHQSSSVACTDRTHMYFSTHSAPIWISERFNTTDGAEAYHMFWGMGSMYSASALCFD